MKLRPASGEMYPWCDFCSNPLGGKCPHDCSYCFTKAEPISWTDKYRKGPLRIWEKDLRPRDHVRGKKIRRRENLPFVPEDALVIFVCDCSDLGKAPIEAQRRILQDCNEAPKNFYLLQSKDPIGFKRVEDYFPPNVIIGTTIETNYSDICQSLSNAPDPMERVRGMLEFKDYRKMVSIEPKLICDPPKLSGMIKSVDPDFVSIGADSKKLVPRSLEPGKEEVSELIMMMGDFTTVYRKSNLDRLLKE